MCKELVFIDLPLLVSTEYLCRPSKGSNKVPGRNLEETVSDRDPNIVSSSLSRSLTESGMTVKVEIYRLEDRPGWALEVINEAGTSTVWDDIFPTDDAAYAAFRDALDAEGIESFLDQATVIPFRR